MNNEKTEQELINELIEKREYFRNKNRLNYHKRKEAGTLKKRPSQKTDYVYKPKNLKENPTIEDIEKLKYIKTKSKQIKIDEVEYKKFLEFKSLIDKINI